MESRLERMQRILANAPNDQLEAWLRAGERTVADLRTPRRARDAAWTQIHVCRAMLARQRRGAAGDARRPRGKAD